MARFNNCKMCLYNFDNICECAKSNKTVIKDTDYCKHFKKNKYWNK